MLSMKPIARVVDGRPRGRGEWIKINSSGTYTGYSYVHPRVRGNGGGQGGDVHLQGGGDFWGERGNSGSIGWRTARFMREDIVVTISPSSSKGLSFDDVLPTSSAFASDGVDGEPVTFSIDGGATESAGGGSGGEGAYYQYNGGDTNFSDHDFVLYVYSGNPVSGDEGRGGAGYSSQPYNQVPAESGAVFLRIED